jgi:ribokinase
MIALADVIIVNRVESKMLGEALFEGRGAVIETRGADGLTVFPKGGGAVQIPAFPAAMVSAHGAGDCFTGALAARLAVGDSLDTAAFYAAAAAALHVAAPPERRLTITPHDVRRLMGARHADGH